MEKTKSLPSLEGSPVFDNLLVAQTAEFLDEVLFAMTVYRLQVSECKAWTCLERALSPHGLRAELFIYDNSPVAQVPPHTIHLKTHYQHDSSNPGISAAYNAAFRTAMNTRKKWLLFLDQDTQLDANAIIQYVEAVNANPSHSLFAPMVMDSRGALSPFQFKNGKGIRVNRFSSAFLPLHEFRAINSGLLVTCELFSKAGGYEESIALDFSDIAFLEKVKPICDSICLVKANLRQEFSGSAALDRSAALERFKKYNEGARQFARRFGGLAEIRRSALLRAVRLTLQWWRTEFLSIHFKTWNE